MTWKRAGSTKISELFGTVFIELHNVGVGAVANIQQVF